MKNAGSQTVKKAKVATQTKRAYYRVNMLDVARLANVSKSTVSRAMKNDPRISEETRQAVASAVKQLNYKTNVLMQSLLTTRTGNIGVLLPAISNSFWSIILTAIENCAYQAGINVMYMNTHGNEEKEKAGLNQLIEKRVDGIIITPSPENLDRQHFVELLNSQIPFVILDRSFSDLAVNYVYSDDYKGSYLATEHLIKLNHQRIGHIGGATSVSSGKDRLQGYLDAMIEHRMPINKDYIICTHFYNMEQYGYDSTMNLLQLKQRPTAIFAETDEAARGVYRAIFERGLRIPEDISVVGYANLDFAEYLRVPLTTVEQPARTLGESAFNLLLKHINDSEAEKETVVLPTKLIVRQSTRMI